jgi:LDH2 family malate/lactate/ureidoglycolate dehydrogenase
LEERLEAFVARVRSVEFSDDIPVGDGAKFERGLLSGESEHRLLVERREEGIPILDETAAFLSELATEYDTESASPF